MAAKHRHAPLIAALTAVVLSTLSVAGSAVADSAMAGSATAGSAVAGSAVAGSAVAGSPAPAFETVAEMELEEQADFAAASPTVEFGLYDVSLTPPSGWRLMSAADLQLFADDFKRAYNEKGGLKVIGTFKSGNCCIGLKRDLMITITGTPYGFQFPQANGKVVCNPKNGYKPNSVLGFYRVPKLLESHKFSEAKKCVINHNPGIFFRVPSRVEFGLYRYDKDPGEGWHLMTVSDLQTFASQFMSQYNRERGLKVVQKGFKTGNCCVAVAGGKKLVITGTKYGYQFLADSTTGKPVCNPADGYHSDKYVFFRSGLLKPTMKFGSASACTTKANPGIFMRALVGTNDAVQFGIYDGQERPSGGGWKLASAADIEGSKEIFVSNYNAQGGVPLIAPFKSGNCCVAVKGGNKLIISGSVYGYQFPASRSGGIRCNPAKGYGERVYGFYRLRTLSGAAKFSERAACSTNHNPTIYVRRAADSDSIVQWWDLADVSGTTTTTAPPSVDCAVEDWNDWTECTRSCGGGKRERARDVKVSAQNGGAACPALIEQGSCNAQDCPVDCAVSDWEKWGPCSNSCGKGFQHRHRSVNQAAAFGGKTCPGLTDVRNCEHPTKCPVDCELSIWSAFSQCSVTCGTGERVRRRIVVTAPRNGGAACGDLQEKKTCDAGACPTHCQVSSFGKWTACTRTCGGGSQQRARLVVTAAANGGMPCPKLHQERTCHVQSCPVDCTVGAWVIDIPCTKTCGGGSEQWRRAVDVDPLHGGKRCPPLIKTTHCATGACPNHCQVSVWGAWTTCDASCHGGQQLRERSIIVHAQHGGYACPALEQQRTCNTHSCPIDCVVDNWASWGPCSKTCGGGSRTRARVVRTQARYGGAACAALNATQSCSWGKCPVDCLLSNWGAWGQCSKTCAGGRQSRTRQVQRSPEWGGKLCDYLQHDRDCAELPCPRDCKMGNWNSWQPCTRTCGTGYQVRHRAVIETMLHGGKACTQTLGERPCGTSPCPVDCKLTSFSDWSGCSASCGQGHRKRWRSVDTAATHGGKACGHLSETKTCQERGCPIHCAMSDWSDWTECTMSCGDGSQSRARTIKVHDRFGGTACGATNDYRSCIKQDCPVHCETSPWGGWSNCNAKCGGGQMHRTRTVKQQPKFNGNHCPHLTESGSCNEHECPRHCKVSEWSAWSRCNAKCGGGMRYHTRDIVIDSEFGGRQCPNLLKKESCNTQPCPVDCRTSEWSAWSACDRTCGGGAQRSTRSGVKEAKHGGVPCSRTKMARERQCNTRQCPPDLFGIYDYKQAPPQGLGGPWKLAAASDLEALKHDFIEFYNRKGGLKVIAPWMSHSCCFTVAGGKKLKIMGTSHAYAPFQFPANAAKGSKSLMCNPKNGYGANGLEERLLFYGVPALNEDEHAFDSGEEKNCHNAHNPAVWMRSDIYELLGKKNTTHVATKADHDPKQCSHVKCEVNKHGVIVIRHHRHERHGDRHWCRIDRTSNADGAFDGKSWHNRPAKRTCSCVCHNPDPEVGKGWKTNDIWKSAIGLAFMAQPSMIMGDHNAGFAVVGIALSVVGLALLGFRSIRTGNANIDGERRETSRAVNAMAETLVLQHSSYGTSQQAPGVAAERMASDDESDEPW